MDAYIGHIITIAVTLVMGGIAWGVLKSNVGQNAKETADQEKRLRDVEESRIQWETHIQGAPHVIERLSAIERQMTELRTELRNRDQTVSKLEDILEANRIVLGELATELAVLKAIRNGGHNA